MKILSGIKPTARPHLGNYFGAMKPHVDLQDENECFYMVADLHALTIPIDPKELKQYTKDLMLDMLAVGYDPSKSVLFLQSHVPEHTELTWIFNCLTPVGELERMIEYKEMIARFPKNANAGLLDYPVLQAVDILIYHPDAVPVGKDQSQHLELTNVIARKFNNRFTVEYFKEVKTLMSKEAAKIMSLANPEKKMSKSLGDDHYISLMDSPEIIRKKISKAVTDSGQAEEMSQGIRNLFDLLKLAGNDRVHDDLMKVFESGALKYVDLKEAVTNSIVEFLAPIQEKRKELEKDPESALKSFEEGTEKARTEARKTMREVKEIVGLK